MVGPGMRWLRALDRKLVRDIWRMKAQAFAIALVIAGGVAVHLLASGMLGTLEETRRAYYERFLFADLWASAVRAPDSLVTDIRRIDGVLAVESRIRKPVLFDMEGMAEPASGEAISLPDDALPTVNRLHLVKGRFPVPEQREEAVMLQSFADAQGIEPGDSVRATIHGGRIDLRIVGIVLSPEYVYAIAPGEIVPDDRRYGVIWMGRRALARSVGQDGAFNEVVLRLAHGASETATIAALDRLLEPYGTPGAHGRRDQVSDAFITSEMEQLQTLGRALPPVFLLVAAFLVNVVTGRMIAVQRSGIGLMKAFGYSGREIGFHYLKMVGIIACLGLAMGLAAGLWLGRAMAGLYMEYFRFPFLVFDLRVVDVLGVAGIALAAILGGALLSVRRAAMLPPAEAMAPLPPPDYSRGIGTALSGIRILDPQSRMILRQILRWPWRAALTIAGISASGALLVGTLFFADALDEMITTSFEIADRHDVMVVFTEPRSPSALHAMARMPGVMTAEPFRSVSARVHSGPSDLRLSILGTPREAALSRLIDARGQPVIPPPGGLVLTADIAQRLGAEAGSVIGIDIAEGRRPRLEIPIAAIATSHVGSGARMEIEDLNRLIGEGPSISGAFLAVDAERVAPLYAELKGAPSVSVVSLHGLAMARLEAMIDESLGVSIVVFILFAGLIALGVVYNAVRISFAERQRELASLRVLGFSRADVSFILLGEVAFLALLALPLGMAAGTGLAWYMSHAMSSDMFRLPFIIAPATYGFSAVVVLAITAASSLLVIRRIHRLDMVEALKTGE